MRFTQSQFVTLWAILELKKKSLCNMQKSGSTLLSVRNCQINREKFIKFMFSKKATKFDKILQIQHNVKSTVKISSILVAFLENMNFTKSLNLMTFVLKSHVGIRGFENFCSFCEEFLISTQTYNSSYITPPLGQERFHHRTFT